MATNSRIALRISGTKERQGGFIPLVSCGVLPGDESNNMDRTTLVKEKPTFVIKQTNEYILYNLFDLFVTPFDNDVDGRFCIALAIPREAKLANKQSPYILLKEIYDTFRANYMKPQGSRDSFINKDIDDELFRQILEKYPLESRDAEPYVQMNPQGNPGVVCVPTDKLEEFFRDTQYPEFRNYKEIEVGSQCQNQVLGVLAQIEIPRPISYEVWQNGSNTLQTLYRSSDAFTTSVHDTAEYEFENVSFTLQELMDSPGKRLEKPSRKHVGSAAAIISLDEQRQRIDCVVNRMDIMYFIQLNELEGAAFQDRASVENELKNGRIRILINGKEKSAYVGGIKASEAKSASVSLNPSETKDYKLAAKGVCDPIKRAFGISVIITKKENHALAMNDKYKGNASNQRGFGSNRTEYDKEVNKLKQDVAAKEKEIKQLNEKHKKKLKKVSVRCLITGVVAGLLIGFIATFLPMRKTIKNEKAKTQTEQKKTAEEQAFSNCCNLVNCEAYLESYPDGKYRADVENRLEGFRDDGAFQIAKDANTEESYNKYKNNYPTGNHVNEANEAIKEIKEEEEKLYTACTTVKRGKKTVNKEKCEEYLEKYPNGKYVVDVNSLLKQQQEDNDKTKSNTEENQKDKKKEEILNLVNDGNYDNCVNWWNKNDNDKKVLSTEQRNSIDYVLNNNKYFGFGKQIKIDKITYTITQEQYTKIRSKLDEKNGNYNSIQDIVDTKKAIMDIIKGSNK